MNTVENWHSIMKSKGGKDLMPKWLHRSSAVHILNVAREADQQAAKVAAD